MSDTSIKQFTEEIMALSTGVWGLGDGSAGILGSSGHIEGLLPELRKNTIELGRELSQQTPDQAKLEELSSAIEGHLETIRVMGLMGEDKCDHLLDELHDLVT